MFAPEIRCHWLHAETRWAGAAKTQIIAKRCVNLFIDAEEGVDENASNDKESDNDNNDLVRFIVADDFEFKIIY